VAERGGGLFDARSARRGDRADTIDSGIHVSRERFSLADERAFLARIRAALA
jgi:uncharacterized membrane protein YidH (DUF202 family)